MLIFPNAEEEILIESKFFKSSIFVAADNKVIVFFNEDVHPK